MARQQLCNKLLPLPGLFASVTAPSCSPLLEKSTLSCVVQSRWASKKQGGSTQNNKDSNPKFLGLKLYGSERCRPGNIIVRQRGTEFHPGPHVGMGRDHTLYSLVEGHVKYTYNKLKGRRFVEVVPLGTPVVTKNRPVSRDNGKLVGVIA